MSSLSSPRSALISSITQQEATRRLYAGTEAHTVDPKWKLVKLARPINRTWAWDGGSKLSSIDCSTSGHGVGMVLYEYRVLRVTDVTNA